MEETKRRLRNTKGKFVLNGGRKCELRDKPCPDCGKFIMRKSQRCRSCSQTGTLHHSFLADKAGYSAIHKWMTKHFGQPRLCESCGTTTAKHYNWANLSYAYKRVRSDWMRLCRTCHIERDKGNNWGKASIRFPKLKGGGAYEFQSR
jgi:hypothetical protein